MPTIIDINQPDFQDVLDGLLNEPRGQSNDVYDVAHKIIQKIRSDGDKALLEYTSQFDFKVTQFSDLKVSEKELDEATQAISPELKQDLKLAYDRIVSFHSKLLPEHLYYTDDTGTQLGLRYTPIDAVGVYIPGGTANYPSSVLMNIIPAKIAGVPRIVAVVPASGGTIDPLVLYALKLAGADEIYKIGGAQAVASLAYGTENIKPVDKITGPGNAYVAEAKKQVFGKVGIDSIAGPSEILVICDETANPDYVAIDLLSQAEHDQSAQSILICSCQETAMQIKKKIDEILLILPRSDIASASWNKYGIIITVDDLKQACEISNQFAPEHLELMVNEPELLLPYIKHAGAIFMGHYTPEAIGDYIAGPNHVLPTNRTTRYASGLSTVDFMKRTTMVKCTEKSFQSIQKSAINLARAEKLEAHALSCAIRGNNSPQDK